jgi:predicted metal-dependent phosphoesterase TrpH
MAGHIDLHMHTVCSDGLLTPEELLERVRQKRLVAFSVTDHDTIDGYLAMSRLIGADDPQLIPGVELSALIEDRDLHLLGYAFDPDNEEFNRLLLEFRERRNHRAREIVEKMDELGLPVPFEAVEKAAAGAPIGRPHIADTLFASGLIRYYEEAFQRYIGSDGPAYVPKARMSPEEAIELVHAAGGVAVMAHPYLSDMYKHVEELARLGLDGIEVYHYSHSRADGDRLRAMADRLGLICTGGSDFHGRSSRGESINSQKVPAAFLPALEQRVQQIRGQQ